MGCAMTLTQQIITIGLCVLGTMLTRFLPFWVFRGGQVPAYVRYLGRALPGAIFGMLVVYCLKGVQWTAGTYGLPELLAILVTIGLHRWKKQMLLSIAGGTVCYMLLVQWVFWIFQKFLERVEIKSGPQSSYKYKRTFKPTGTGASKASGPADGKIEMEEGIP